MGKKFALSNKEDLAVYRRLIGYLKPYVLRLAGAGALMIILSGTSGLLAFLVKPVMDDIFIARDVTKLHLIPVAIILIFLVKSFSDYGRYYLMADVGQRIILDIRNRLYGHIQTLSLKFFQKTPTGVLISRITNDVNMVQSSVTNAVTGLIKEIFTILALIGVVFYRDWQLAVIAMFVFPAVAVPINRFGQRLKRYSTKSMHVMGDIMTILDEAISGIRIVKAYNMEEYERGRFEIESRRYYRNWMKRLAVRAMSSPLMELIGGFAISFLIWYGGMKVIQGVKTPGDFFSFITAVFMLYAPIRKLNDINIEIQEGIAAAKRVFQLMDLPPDMEEKAGARALGRASGHVAYKDVYFSYDDGGEYALKGASFEVPSGRTVAFVGESGAGKTTIINLLPRFYDVSSGSILVDGHDIRDLTLTSLRANIAMVTQEMVLFNDTIKANICYGSQDASLEKVIEAAKAANAHDFIMQMPEGYDTVVGEAGVRLSGGQRQRICIARAIIKDAPILILDEATSSLDTESEKEVHAALDKLMAGRTTLIIAHRLSTVIGADHIIALNRGVIVEEGTHAELLARNGYYTRLYNLQFGDAADHGH
ncbi:MAG TPA: lipid A export permease/ATP-binding protein MsbA [Deltaproteobacteria bacterium]|nr:lipid A export permease/ATP-binding protein MsbA [Deltaproteobacteria bacterium]